MRRAASLLQRQCLFRFIARCGHGEHFLPAVLASILQIPFQVRVTAERVIWQLQLQARSDLSQYYPSRGVSAATQTVARYFIQRATEQIPRHRRGSITRAWRCLVREENTRLTFGTEQMNVLVLVHAARMHRR